MAYVLTMAFLSTMAPAFVSLSMLSCKIANIKNGFKLGIGIHINPRDVKYTDIVALLHNVHGIGISLRQLRGGLIKKYV